MKDKSTERVCLDILGRELKPGSLVVCKANTNKRMEIGIFTGKSVITYTGHRKTNDMYLIEQPSKLDMIEREKIEEKQRKQKERTKEAEKQRIKADEIGGIYLSADNKIYVYLGNCKVTLTSPREKLITEKIGHLYICASHYYNNEVRDYSIDTILEQIKSGYYYFMNNEIEFGTLATLKSTKRLQVK